MVERTLRAPLAAASLACAVRPFFLSFFPSKFKSTFLAYVCGTCITVPSSELSSRQKCTNELHRRHVAGMLHRLCKLLARLHKPACLAMLA